MRPDFLRYALADFAELARLELFCGMPISLLTGRLVTLAVLLPPRIDHHLKIFTRNSRQYVHHDPQPVMNFDFGISFVCVKLVETFDKLPVRLLRHELIPMKIE